MVGGQRVEAREASRSARSTLESGQAQVIRTYSLGLHIIRSYILRGARRGIAAGWLPPLLLATHERFAPPNQSVRATMLARLLESPPGVSGDVLVAEVTDMLLSYLTVAPRDLL